MSSLGRKLKTKNPGETSIDPPPIFQQSQYLNPSAPPPSLQNRTAAQLSVSKLVAVNPSRGDDLQA